MDGEPHLIHEGTDFRCPINILRSQAYQNAATRKRKVSIKKVRDGEYKIQARIPGQVQEQRYDWKLLLDGEVHQLRARVDFTAKPESFRAYAREVAAARGLRLSIKSLGDSVFLQAIREPAPPVPAEPIRPSAEILAELPFEMEGW